MTTKDWLDLADLYAKRQSGCCKVNVGSAIVKDGILVSLGANQTLPKVCKHAGCLRVEKYGDDSKAHRNPEDCRAIHSEVDAICAAAMKGHSTEGATIFVTRYPCESCAKAIIGAGIKKVFYGGSALISKETTEIFDKADVNAYFVEFWKEDNTDK